MPEMLCMGANLNVGTLGDHGDHGEKAESI